MSAGHFYDGTVPPRLLELFAANFPPMRRVDEYRNRFGELVTCSASEDGRFVMLQTWPEGSQAPAEDLPTSPKP